MLTMIFVLIAAIGIGMTGARWPLLLAVAALLATWAGTTFPDVDQCDRPLKV